MRKLCLFGKKECYASEFFVPRVEQLELRCVPAGNEFRWDPVPGHGDNWSTTWTNELLAPQSNWDIKVGGFWVRASAYPGADDSVLFEDDVFDNTCVINDGIEIGSMELAKNFTGDVRLKGSLTVFKSLDTFQTHGRIAGYVGSGVTRGR